jgi:hypothetical protein
VFQKNILPPSTWSKEYASKKPTEVSSKLKNHTCKICPDTGQSKPENNYERAMEVTTVYKETHREPIGAKEIVPQLGSK